VISTTHSDTLLCRRRLGIGIILYINTRLRAATGYKRPLSFASKDCPFDVCRSLGAAGALVTLSYFVHRAVRTVPIPMYLYGRKFDSAGTKDQKFPTELYTNVDAIGGIKTINPGAVTGIFGR